MIQATKYQKPALTKRGSAIEVRALVDPDTWREVRILAIRRGITTKHAAGRLLAAALAAKILL